ncbi:MAG: aminopeptidase, partial [Proteobacteria bacterium]|nr:aminopeptidase [Pseudomonadota bacterium]
MERPNAWKSYSAEDKAAVFGFADGYREFLSKCKTERECVTELKRLAIAHGFRDMADVIRKGETLRPGDRVFADNKGKNLLMYIIGSEDLEKGMNILGAHLDSPRLDLKQNPLYEDTELALLDTHYYGGIKIYLWGALQLAIHCVVVKKDGTVV